MAGEGGAGFVGEIFADANGNLTYNSIFLYRGSGIAGVYAVSTTASGQPITSNTVDSPCG